MKARLIPKALVLASVLQASNAWADDSPIDDNAMRAALQKYYRDSLIIGSLTHAAGATALMLGTAGVMEPEIYPMFKRVGFALLPFGALQSLAGTFPMMEGAIGLATFDPKEEFVAPLDFVALQRREAKIAFDVLRVALIADLVITGLSIPLLFPNERFREWKGFAVLMVAEGIFSAATGYARYLTLETHINNLDRFAKYVSPPMGPQSVKPIIFDMKFAF